MVTLIVYFVVLVNVAKGLRQVDADAPRAAPLVRGVPVRRAAQGPQSRTPSRTCSPRCKIAAPLAVITAFVAEYFGGPQNGLGSRITATVSGSRAAMWAYVLAAMLLGLLFYLVSIALESLTTQHRGASPRGDNT